MAIFLIEGNVLDAEINTNKYRDYIYERITGKCFQILPVGFMRKKHNCKVIILENVQLLVKKDIKSSQEHKRNAPHYNFVNLFGNGISIGY